MVAYRTLNDEIVQDKKRSLKNFQLIVKFNPLSVIRYTKDDSFENIIDIHFFPAISNEILHFAKPCHFSRRGALEEQIQRYALH